MEARRRTEVKESRKFGGEQDAKRAGSEESRKQGDKE